MKIMFGNELCAAAQTGQIHTDIYAFWYQVSCQLVGDVQDMEGINNLIQVALGRAPRMLLATVSARVNIRKALSLGHRGASHKWSDIKATVQQVANFVADNFDGANIVLGNSRRWEPPSGAGVKLKSCQTPLVLDPRLRVTRAIAWAIPAQTKLTRHLFPERGEANVDCCISFGAPVVAGSVWFAASKHAVTCHLVRGVVEQCDGTFLQVSLVRPLEFAPATRAIASCYSGVVENDAGVPVYAFTMAWDTTTLDRGTGTGRKTLFQLGDAAVHKMPRQAAQASSEFAEVLEDETYGEDSDYGGDGLLREDVVDLESTSESMERNIAQLAASMGDPSMRAKLDKVVEETMSGQDGDQSSKPPRQQFAVVARNRLPSPIQCHVHPSTRLSNPVAFLPAQARPGSQRFEHPRPNP